MEGLMEYTTREIMTAKTTIVVTTTGATEDTGLTTMATGWAAGGGTQLYDPERGRQRGHIHVQKFM